jgi:hypothetical protein
MTRRNESLTVSLRQEDKVVLETIALQFGCSWGDKPNISALLKAIAVGSLKVIYNDDLPPAEIKKNQARQAIEKIKTGLDELVQAL